MRIDRQDLYALLRARNIPYEETAHPAVWSMEELHALCLPGEERILKNLFLRDDKKRRYYLVAIDGGPDGRPEGPAPDTGQPSSEICGRPQTWSGFWACCRDR